LSELCTLSFGLCIQYVELTNKAQSSKHKAQKSNSDCQASFTRKRDCLLLE
jgi:hypothetical protein